MPEQLGGFKPEVNNEQTQETIEQKRERFALLIKDLNSPSIEIKTSDILSGKDFKFFPQKSVFLAEIIVRQKEKEKGGLFKKEALPGHTQKSSIISESLISDTLRPVIAEDENLLRELLAMSDEDLVELGAHPKHTHVDEKTIDKRYREILVTAQDMLRYLKETHKRNE